MTPLREVQSVPPRAERIEVVPHRRMKRMRFLSRLLDNSIPLPGGYRIGLDPIIGLAPGVGDMVASTLSLWMLYDAARLGIPKHALGRMLVNIIIETLVGAFPVLGDFFDAVWKANARNMAIAEAAYAPGLKPRSFGSIAFVLIAILLVVWSLIFVSAYFVLTLLGRLFSAF